MSANEKKTEFAWAVDRSCFRLHYLKLLVLFKFEMVYVVLPPCVGCESVCDDVYNYIYVEYARCLYICLYGVYIFMLCTVGTRSFIR